MKKPYNTFSLFFLAIFLTGCEKDLDSIGECIHNFSFPNNLSEPSAEDSYFFGTLNDKNMGLAPIPNSINFYNAFYNGLTTYADNPEWVQGTDFEFRGLFFKVDNYTPIIPNAGYFSLQLYGPQINIFDFHYQSELDKLATADNLPFSTSNGDGTKFQFSISFGCYRSDQYSIDHTHKQPNSSYIKVADFKKTDIGTGWKYEILFDINMVMYFRDMEDRERKYGTINAKFNTVTYVWR